MSKKVATLRYYEDGGRSISFKGSIYWAHPDMEIRTFINQIIEKIKAGHKEDVEVLSIDEGQKVKVMNNLSHDPFGKSGERGIIHRMIRDYDEALVVFPDKITAIFQSDCLEAV